MPSVRPSEYSQRAREDGGPFAIIVPCLTPDGDENPEVVDVVYSEVPEEDVNDSTPVIKIMTVSMDSVCIWPVETRAHRADYLQPKYEALRLIILSAFTKKIDIPSDQDDVEALLERLPAGLVKDFRFGLGFLWEYRQIVEMIERIPGVDTLLITGGDIVGIDPASRMFMLGEKRLESIRLEINRTAGRYRADALRDKRHLLYHLLLNAADPLQYPAKAKMLKKDILSELTRGGTDTAEVSTRDRRVAVKLVGDSVRKLAHTESQTLLALKAEIELATLEQLISKFDAMLEKASKESAWQRLFEDNPFILSLAFAVPVFLLQGNAYVGGKRLSGRAGKFADFVYATCGTGNLAIIEIKRPDTDLVAGKRAYRGDDVFGPSNDLGGAVAQLLDQKQKLIQYLPNIKESSDRNDIHAHSVRGIIVAGTLPSETVQRRSLELFRGALSQIEIVTFDELRTRLIAVKEALTPPNFPPVPVPGASTWVQDAQTEFRGQYPEDVPF